VAIYILFKKIFFVEFFNLILSCSSMEKVSTGKAHPRQRLEFSEKRHPEQKKIVFFSCLFCLLLMYDVKRIQREKNEDIVMRKKFIFIIHESYFFCLPFRYKKEKYLYKNDIPMKRIHKKYPKRNFCCWLACSAIKLILKQVFSIF